MSSAIQVDNGSAFMATLKAKVRRPSKQPPGVLLKPSNEIPPNGATEIRKKSSIMSGSSSVTTTSTDSPTSTVRKKSSFLSMASGSGSPNNNGSGGSSVRKPSFISLLGRKLSGEKIEEPAAELNPPMSPIFPADGSRLSKLNPKHLPPSPIPVNRQVVVSESQHLPLPSKSSSPIISGGRSSIAATGENRISRIVSNASDLTLRERSPSMTSMDSVYGRTGRNATEFEMSNPLLGHGSTAGSGRKQSLIPTSSAADLDIDRAKRASLYNSAASHVNQSKLLERRATRTTGGRMSVSITREANSYDTLTPLPVASYERDAFSNPEPVVQHESSPLALPKPLKKPSLHATSSASQDGLYSREGSSTNLRKMSQTSDTSARRPSLVTQKSNLRSKRANSKLLHDRNNYSNTVLNEVQQAAELAALKLRRAELHLFFMTIPNKPAKVDGVGGAEYLLERYSPEDLAGPLYRLYSRLPIGWEVYLSPELAEKLKKQNGGCRQSLDQGNLHYNLQQLMGETTFVASQQIAKFQRANNNATATHSDGDKPH